MSRRQPAVSRSAARTTVLALLLLNILISHTFTTPQAALYALKEKNSWTETALPQQTGNDRIKSGQTGQNF